MIDRDPFALNRLLCSLLPGDSLLIERPPFTGEFVFTVRSGASGHTLTLCLRENQIAVQDADVVTMLHTLFAELHPR